MSIRVLTEQKPELEPKLPGIIHKLSTINKGPEEPKESDDPKVISTSGSFGSF